MQKLFFLTMLISVAGFSQQLKYGTAGTIYTLENQKIKPAAVRELMKGNPAALSLYNVGRQKKTWGNALFYGGFGLGAINLITAVYGNQGTVTPTGPYSYSYRENRSSPALAIVGGAMLLASIPIKLGYPKKIKTAINEHNQGIVYTETQKPEATLLANTQGLGIKIQF